MSRINALLLHSEVMSLELENIVSRMTRISQSKFSLFPAISLYFRHNKTMSNFYPAAGTLQQLLFLKFEIPCVLEIYQQMLSFFDSHVR